jgi:hypothetical protein
VCPGWGDDPRRVGRSLSCQHGTQGLVGHPGHDGSNSLSSYLVELLPLPEIKWS